MPSMPRGRSPEQNHTINKDLQYRQNIALLNAYNTSYPHSVPRDIIDSTKLDSIKLDSDLIKINTDKTNDECHHDGNNDDYHDGNNDDYHDGNNDDYHDGNNDDYHDGNILASLSSSVKDTTSLGEKKLNQALKPFGITKLKDKQKEIIKNIQAKHDVLAVLPTGYGKSITYLIHYFLENKTIIVVSPLIALMEDQYNSLQQKNIPSIMLNQINESKQQDMQKVLEGNPHIVFTSPEYFVTCESFVRMLAKMDALALIAVDESHLISTWRGFRPQYSELSCVTDWAPQVPKLAVTATATPSIIQCILETLQMKDPIITKASFKRHNLELSAQHKTSLRMDIISIVDKINKHDGKTIIYCKSKKETEMIASHLHKKMINCKHYHAGMSKQYRTETQTQFTKGLITTLTATVAFGMGVDIPDIRLVIHYSMPSSIESLYQEIGRAGRDGLPSQCHMFWSAQDVVVNRQLVDREYDLEALVEEKNALEHTNKTVLERHKQQLHSLKNPKMPDYRVQKKALIKSTQTCLEECQEAMRLIEHKLSVRAEKHANIVKVEQYCSTTDCRMAFICKHFDESIQPCTLCDNCRSDNDFVDIAEIAYSVISTLLQSYNGLGIGTLCDLLRGKKTKHTTKVWHFTTTGTLKKYKNDYLRQVISDLKSKYLVMNAQVNRYISVMRITQAGQVWYRQYSTRPEPLVMKIKKKGSTTGASTTGAPLSRTSSVQKTIHHDEFSIFDELDTIQ